MPAWRPRVHSCGPGDILLGLVNPQGEPFQVVAFNPEKGRQKKQRPSPQSNKSFYYNPESISLSKPDFDRPPYPLIPGGGTGPWDGAEPVNYQKRLYPDSE